MLKGLVKSGLVKKSTTKYNKVLAGKSSAYDKWQKAIEKETVRKAEAPVIMETLETGEVVPHKKPEPQIKIIPYAKVWEASGVKDDENTIYCIRTQSSGCVRKRVVRDVERCNIFFHTNSHEDTERDQADGGCLG